MEVSIDKVIGNGYCIGCGVCTATTNSPYRINFDNQGKYQAIKADQNKADKEAIAKSTKVCPFSNESKNENELMDQQFGNLPGIHFEKNIGYYLKTYAGSVKVGTFRSAGSSGGIGTWIAAKMLENKLVDSIIHVRPKQRSSKLFSFQISKTTNDLFEGAKSKYYPVTLAEVLELVKKNRGEYLLIGIPCFIKAVRLLSLEEPIIKERIKYTLGLVCGHLKTDWFARSIGWQVGVPPDELESIDFRVKLPNSLASRYGVFVKGKNRQDGVVSQMNGLIGSNWGHGLFRYKACDFCDDVLAETADVTIGDAWLPKYVQNSLGTNILITRNSIIQSLIERHQNELELEEISTKSVYKSQAGGFRNRREGLGYRLYLNDKNKIWRPEKRVAASFRIRRKRRKVYDLRMELLEKGNSGFEKALKENDFRVFKSVIDPLLEEYRFVYSTQTYVRPFLRILSLVRKICGHTDSGRDI